MALKRALTVTVDISDVVKQLGNVAILAHPADARRIMAEVLAEVIDSSTIGEMHGRASGLGAMHGAAASGLNYARLSDGVTITAGGVEWVAGSEFGGRIKVMTYQTRSRAGNPYTVTRHTTMQFNPWRGQKGYWMWPTITERMQGIREKLITALMDNAVGKAS
jgi:hypothetical protein